jgi:hypothetical protein
LPPGYIYDGFDGPFHHRPNVIVEIMDQLAPDRASSREVSHLDHMTPNSQCFFTGFVGQGILTGGL